MRRRRWPALVPFLLLAVLTAALGLRVQARLESPPPPLPTPGAATAETGTPPSSTAPARSSRAAPLETPPRRAFADVVARNLFARDRRPPPRPAPEASGPVRRADKLEARLTGVVLGGGAQRAILYDTKAETIARLDIGDRLRGWRLIAVDANSATFQAGGQSRTLSLNFGDGAAASANAPTGGDGPRATPQRAARTDESVDGRSLRAIRRGHMGGLDRDPARSLLNAPAREDGRPRRANRRPDVPDSGGFD